MSAQYSTTGKQLGDLRKTLQAEFAATREHTAQQIQGLRTSIGNAA